MRVYVYVLTYVHTDSKGGNWKASTPKASRPKALHPKS